MTVTELERQMRIKADAFVGAAAVAKERADVRDFVRAALVLEMARAVLLIGPRMSEEDVEKMYAVLQLNIKPAA